MILRKRTSDTATQTVAKKGPSHLAEQTTIPGFQTIRVIFALMVREMITRYGRSFGGYFWAIAEPVGMIALLSMAFSSFLRLPPLGSSFILFYAAGYLPFSFFMSINQTTSLAVQANRALMSFPVVSPLDAILARAILQFLTMIVVSVVILVGLSFLISEPVRPNMEQFMMACVAAAILGMGGGTLNVVLYAFIPSYKNIWAIITRPLFIVSGIFYTVESMPASLQAILVLNPLVHISGEAHKAFYPIYEGSYVNLAYPIGLGLGMFILGTALLIRHRSYIVENA